MGARPGRSAHGLAGRQGPETSKTGALARQLRIQPRAVIRSLTSKFPSAQTLRQLEVPISLKLPSEECRSLGLPEHSAELKIGHGCVHDGHGGRSVVSAGKPMSTRSQQSFEDPCWLD